MSAVLSARVADSADLDDIVALDPIAQSSPRRRGLILRSVAQGECFIATVENKSIGYVILNYSFYEYGFIPLLYVAEVQRRKGVGIALMQHAERLCRTAKLFTSTNVSNMAMQNLLHRRGFTPSGVITNLDIDVDELVFFKRLSDRELVDEFTD